MKIKDLVDLKGCYSAHDVGELEIKEVSAEELAGVIQLRYFKFMYPDITENDAQIVADALAKAILSKYNITEKPKKG